MITGRLRRSKLLTGLRDVIRAIKWVLLGGRFDTYDHLESAFYGRDQVFFVQIGSNDGKNNDPIYGFAKKRTEWTGIFVEPIPSVFEALKLNYDEDQRFSFENAVVSTENGEVSFYQVGESAKDDLKSELPNWYSQLGSLDRAHIEKHLEGKLIPHIIERKLPSLTLSRLLEKNGCRRLDLIHIDAEGFDYQILKQLNFSAFRPKVIIFEHFHLRPEERDSAIALCFKEGYRVYDLGMDMLAARQIDWWLRRFLAPYFRPRFERMKRSTSSG